MTDPEDDPGGDDPTQRSDEINWTHGDESQEPRPEGWEDSRPTSPGDPEQGRNNDRTQPADRRRGPNTGNNPGRGPNTGNNPGRGPNTGNNPGRGPNPDPNQNPGDRRRPRRDSNSTPNQPPRDNRGPNNPPGPNQGRGPNANPNQPRDNRGPNNPPGPNQGHGPNANPNQPRDNRGPNTPPGPNQGRRPNANPNQPRDNRGPNNPPGDRHGPAQGTNPRDQRRPRGGPSAQPRSPEARRQYGRDERRGQRPPKGPEDDRQYSTDPVKAMFLGSVDLYDIATWEDRSGLDSFAVSLTNVLRRARMGALIAAGVVLFLAQIAVAGLLVIERPLLAVLTLLSVLPAMGLAGYIWYGDPTTREPFALLGATFALSVLFASFAAVVNTTLQPAFGLLGILGGVAFFFLVVAPVEEFVKWLAIRVYAYKSDVFRTVLDGAVYGAIAGLGFASIENFIYIASVYFETTPPGIDSQTQYAAIVAGQRAFAGPGHVIFSSWAGFYLGLAKFNKENRGPIIVKGLLIAAFIHALYNTLVTILPLTILTLFGFIIIYHGFWFAMLYRKISAYKELYQRLGYTGRPAERTR